MDVAADRKPGLVTPSEYLYPILNASAWEIQNPAYSSVHLLLVTLNMLSKWNETVHRVFPMKVCQLDQGSGRAFVLAIRLPPHALFKPGHRQSRHHTLHCSSLWIDNKILANAFRVSTLCSHHIYSGLKSKCLHSYHYESFLTHLKWLWGGSESERRRRNPRCSRGGSLPRVVLKTQSNLNLTPH
jgi:hypothetical protein